MNLKHSKLSINNKSRLIDFNLLILINVYYIYTLKTKSSKK